MSSLKVLLVIAWCGLGQADQSDVQRQAEVDAWRQSLEKMTGEYRMSIPDQSKDPCPRVERPVFLWNQPVRHGQIGAIYLWLQHDERPAAIGTIFAWRPGTPAWLLMHEFHSLAQHSLTLDFRGRTVWAPTEPGLQWKPFEERIEVASSRQRQLTQIRQLAQKFRAHTVTLEKDTWELRLISRPLYEYATGDGEAVMCGAVFAMCHGTDPELILVIEAKSTDTGRQYQFACGAFTDYELHCQFGDKEVWSAAATPEGTDFSPAKRYWREFISTNAPTPPLTLDSDRK